MLFATKYTFKGDQSPESIKEMLAVFAERGAQEGEVAHYVAANGRGGLIIGEADSMEDGYENMLHYSQWMDFDVTPILPIDVAMGAIMKVYG